MSTYRGNGSTTTQPRRFGAGISPPEPTPMPEPPPKLTPTPPEPTQPASQLAHRSRPRHSFTYEYHGFAVTSTVEGEFSKLGAVLDKLQELGATPILPPNPIDYTPEGLPICPKHRVPMRERDKQKQSLYSHKVINEHGEELYCKGHPGASSPGWRVPANLGKPT